MALYEYDEPMEEPDFSNDPSDLNNKPVAFDVSPDVVQKIQNWGKRSKPMIMRDRSNRLIVALHRSPEGYYYVGDPQINSGDNSLSNNGWVHPDNFQQWLEANGLSNAHIASCYAVNENDTGDTRNYFQNKSKLGLSTYQSPTGQSKVVFENV
jgi:hypothetical protein